MGSLFLKSYGNNCGFSRNSIKRQLNGDYPMKKCKSSTIALHFYEPVVNNSILRAEVTKKVGNEHRKVQKSCGILIAPACY